jgi:Ca-activated chloride channel family protein
MLLIPVLASCSRLSGKLLVMEGNFFSSRGMYTEAISSYSRALRYGEAAPYGEYGLGAVYLFLDEGKAAQQRFAAAEKALRLLPREYHLELSYRIRYNDGIIRFEEGDYRGAAGQFRKALEIDGSRIEAKRNLELSLLSLSRMNAPVSAPSAPAGGGGAEALFDYIRQKEQAQWKSREWNEDIAAGPDY